MINEDKRGKKSETSEQQKCRPREERRSIVVKLRWLRKKTRKEDDEVEKKDEDER